MLHLDHSSPSVVDTMKGNTTGNRETIRTLILGAIVAQNATYTLARSEFIIYSELIIHPRFDRKYSTMTESVMSEEVLFIAEILKLIMSILFILTSQEKSDTPGQGVSKLYWYVLNIHVI